MYDSYALICMYLHVARVVTGRQVNKELGWLFIDRRKLLRSICVDSERARDDKIAFLNSRITRHRCVLRHVHLLVGIQVSTY